MTRRRVMKLEYDTIVIGSGVAGMSAAIYLKRSGLNVMIIEKSAPGGQINQTSSIENYPGYLKIDGPTLAMNMFEQVSSLNIPYEYGTVSTIKEIECGKEVVTDVGVYHTRTVLIATGRVPNKLNVPGEESLINHGLSWCALCDGSFYKNKVVGVVGSGNSALEESLYLSGICSKVIMLNRGDHYKGSKFLLEQVKKKENIEIHYRCSVKALNETSGNLSSIIVTQEGENKHIDLEGLFIYIGYHPDTEILNDFPILREEQYLVVNEHMKTNIDGIYACGDVIKKEVYQIVTAVSEGAIAATQIQKDISNQKEM